MLCMVTRRQLTCSRTNQADSGLDSIAKHSQQQAPEKLFLVMPRGFGSFAHPAWQTSPTVLTTLSMPLCCLVIIEHKHAHTVQTARLHSTCEKGGTVVSMYCRLQKLPVYIYCAVDSPVCKRGQYTGDKDCAGGSGEALIPRQVSLTQS